MARNFKAYSGPLLGGFAALAVLAGCGASAPADDPLARLNHAVHAFNIGADRAVIGPVARLTAPIFKSPVGTAIDNMADNMGEPANIANDLLQVRFHNAAHNTLRFMVNTTVGGLGAWDAAAAAGAEERKTDFGATLHRWGMGEGAFVMLPFFGPSNLRDATGIVADAVMDPLGHALPRSQRDIPTVFTLTSKVGDRARYSETVESVLYGSADSYSQLRLMYEQSRRFELGQEASDDAFIDPYEDAAGE